jgi:hypothetical protein
VQQATASDDGTTVAMTDGLSVIVRDARTGRLVRRFDVAGQIALSPDGGTLAVGHGGGVGVFSVATGKRTGGCGGGVSALAFSPDGRALAAIGEGGIWARAVASLVGAEKPVAQWSPSATPLAATLISRKPSYVIDLGGKPPEEFACRIRAEKELPATPEVDMELSIRNTSGKVVVFEKGGEFSGYLIGPGAVNHPSLPYQTFYIFDPERRPPDRVTLHPGESYSVSLKNLDYGHSQRSYWLLPGEYTLYVSYHITVKPDFEGKPHLSDGWGFGTIYAPPMRVNVVAEKGK